MTAENGAVPDRLFSRLHGFNEAAADDRGKLEPQRPAGRRCDVASMRPRPMTAENGQPVLLVLVVLSASMRPRPMTAENRPAAARWRPTSVASMRPRPMTAENVGAAVRAIGVAVASMRPRPMTAENPRRPLRGLPAGARFNEAAADDRGKRAASG